jgi:BrxA
VLLHDVVTEVLLPLQASGKIEVAIGDILTPLARWVAEGKTAGHWSEPTLVRVAQGLMATLRDFGVLQGAIRKRLAPMYLPVEAFAYIAFFLHQEQPSGERLLDHPEWRLFFLSPQAVERFLVEAHQHHLLEYHAAGSIIRISFPTGSIEEYAHALIERAH